ncbi:MAG: 50S ribosomal protein L4 [Chitinivibrionales bacterium]|nr:50S ribosomal protein L4 [Chitinivibrionales bacterium]MBD3396948.1 50S ribosomal protein L4 [Chitinivibrionales bacterium]
MKAKLYTQAGKAKGEVDLPDEVFGAEINEHLMHTAIRGYLANQRQGTTKAKGRSEVSGGGAKPFRQKGTGNARAGSNASPLWVRGGKAFGPRPVAHTMRIPKKVRRQALRSALSSRARDEKILVIEKLAMDKPATKTVATLLKAMAAADARTLLVVDGGAREIYLSGRNIKNVQVRPLAELHTYDVLNNENIVFAGKELVEKSKEVVSL